MQVLFPLICVRWYYKYLLHRRAGILELAYCIYHLINRPSDDLDSFDIQCEYLKELAF